MVKRNYFWGELKVNFQNSSLSTVPPTFHLLAIVRRAMASSWRRSEPYSPQPSSADEMQEADHLDQAPPSADSNRKRAKRVFTDEDEIMLLESLCKATDKSVSSLDGIDTPTFEKMHEYLGPRFTRTQVSDKLRRLRVKYRKQTRNKSSIKTPHDRQIYEIARKIWSKDKAGVAEEHNGAPPQSQSLSHGQKSPEEAVPLEVDKEGKKEGGVYLQEFPLLVAECERAFEGNGMWRQVLKGLDEGKLRKMNEKLVMLKYEEAVLVAKKAELVQELSRMILGAVAASCSASRTAA